MALRRYRVAMTAQRYVILDHGEPVGTTRIGPNQAGEGEVIPQYRQDGDPEDINSGTFVVWTSQDRSPESFASAQAEANARNAAWEEESDAHDKVLSELDYRIEESA